MLFHYSVIDKNGHQLEGEIDASSQDVAITSLQSRGFVITSIQSADKKPIWEMNLSFLERVSGRDIVILSRQISTLFEAQVSALRIFRLLGEEADNPTLQRILTQVADDLQGGSSISQALSKHPKVFSDFYINMVRTGEETGKLDSTFRYLADYLERSYEVTSKARGALVYPAFVILTFFGVMWIMLAIVIPRLGEIMKDSGVEPPVYTKVVLGLSSVVSNYGWIVLVLLVILGFVFYRYHQTEAGHYQVDSLKLRIPGVGNLYQKLYLSRISDNFSTMLTSGISMVRTLEITSAVVGNDVYKEALLYALQEVKNGASLSGPLSQYPHEIPRIMVQMIKVGEETGELGSILDTLSRFYRREVENAVDTLISLIEPAMIVFLGVGVGLLLASVLIPIFNITMSIQ